jgi:UPF0271 protein
MAARQAEVAEAIADAADVFKVPLFGMINTQHEAVYTARGHRFVAEYYADLDYDDDGRVIITREHDARDPAETVRRCREAISSGTTTSANGKPVRVRAESICVHSDTPNAVELAKAVREALA